MYFTITTPDNETFSFDKDGDGKISYSLVDDMQIYVGSMSSFDLYGDDYKLLKNYEKAIDNREFTFRASCVENTPYIFQGYFTIFDCDWCDDECKVTVKLQEKENNKDLIKADTEYNVLDSNFIEVPRYTANTIDPNDGVTSINIDNFMKLEDVILYLAKKDAPYIVDVQSDFLTNSTNPVTGLANKYKDIYIIEKSDVVDWDATNNATILNMSFLGLMENLNNLLNVTWWVDGYSLRIEHESYNYFENDLLDLTNYDVIKMDDCYNYDKIDVNKGIEIKLQEGEQDKFTSKQINYIDSFGREIENNGEYKDANCDDVCLDFRFMLTDGKTENLEGYALGIIEGGILESQVVGTFRDYNYSLGLNILDSFHLNVSKLITSTPDYLIHYNSVLPYKNQEDIVLKLKCKNLKEFPKKITRVKTNIGIGILQDYEYDLSNCQLTLNAKIY